MPDIKLPDEVIMFRSSVKLLLVTATDIETEGLLKQVDPFPGSNEINIIYSGNHTYYIGVFGVFGAVVVQSGMGAVGSASSMVTTMKAIKLWQPNAIIMVGIAFGVSKKEQKVGDVLVSSHIIPYEFSKVRTSGIEFRSELPSASLFLRNRVKNFRGWKFEIDGRLAKVFLGPLLTGEKLIDDPVFLKSLIDPFPNAIGGEMESAGVYAAAAEENVPWIIIKGICDFADGKKAHKKERNQQLAITTAVDFTNHLFKNRKAFEELLFETTGTEQDKSDSYNTSTTLKDLILLLDAGSVSSTETLTERFRLISREIFQNIGDEEILEQTNRTIELVPTNTLAIFTQRLNTCWNDYNNALASEDAFSDAELDRATNALMRCICRELARISKLNGNTVPDNGQWKNWWNTYNCRHVSDASR